MDKERTLLELSESIVKMSYVHGDIFLRDKCLEILISIAKKYYEKGCDDIRNDFSKMAKRKNYIFDERFKRILDEIQGK